MSEPGSRFAGTGRKTPRKNSFHVNGTRQIRDIYMHGEIPFNVPANVPSHLPYIQPLTRTLSPTAIFLGWSWFVLSAFFIFSFRLLSFSLTLYYSSGSWVFDFYCGSLIRNFRPFKSSDGEMVVVVCSFVLCSFGETSVILVSSCVLQRELF